MKNRSLKSILSILAAGVLVLAMLNGCRNDVDSSTIGQKIKIGVIGPFSGADRSWGENGLLGIQAALDYYYQQGGRTTVEIIREDDKNDPGLALNALQKLVTVDQVSALLVLSGSGAMLAMAERADSFGTPIVSTLSTHPAITDNEWVSQVSFDDNLQGKVSALFVMDELLIDRAAVLWDSEDPHSYALHDQFLASFESAGGTVVSADQSVGAGDYGELVRQLKQNEIEFVYIPADVSTVISFEKAAASNGYHPQVMISDGILSQMMLEHADSLQALNGVLAIDIFSSEAPLTDFGRAVRSQFQNTFKAPGTTIAALNCEGMIALLAAVDRCGGSVEKQCLNSMLRGGYQVGGIMESFRINRYGKAERPVFINEVSNRKLRFLFKVN